MKGLVALFIAVVLGLVAVLGVRAYMNKLKQETRDKLKPVKVLVAAKRIEPGTKISSAMIETMEVAESAVDQDHILPQEIFGVVGATAAQAIDRGQAIKWTALQRERPRLTAVLPPSMVGIAIPVDNVSGVAFNVRPGSRVDILGSFSMPTSGQGAQTITMITRRLLTNVLVLAVDNRTAVEVESVAGQPGVVRYSTVTLAVTPEESVILTFARMQGNICLALRNATDELSAEPPEVTLQNVTRLAESANQKRRQKAAEAESPLTGVSAP